MFWTAAAAAPGPASAPTPGAPGTGSVSTLTGDVLTNVAENVLTNLLTVVVLPLVIPALFLLLGACIHLVAGDFRDWRQSVSDFRRLALDRGGARQGLGRAVQYWLALLFVLLTGRLSDASLFDGRPDEKGGG
jgi:hypothetical protein